VIKFFKSFYIYNTTQFLKILLFKKIHKKSPSAKAKGLEIVKLLSLYTFGTFNENIKIDNIELNQLVLL
jgi:hypothetical protein